MIHIEVKKKIIEAGKSGLKISEISRAYQVGESAVYILLFSETGNIEANTSSRDMKSTINETQFEEMRELITIHPDITLEELRESIDLSINKFRINVIINDVLGFRYKNRQYMPVNESVPIL